MSLTQQRPTTAIESIPETIDSPRAKLVYLYLTIDNGGTLTELHQTLGLPKLTLLSVINSLSSSGHIDRIEDQYVTV